MNSIPAASRAAITFVRLSITPRTVPLLATQAILDGRQPRDLTADKLLAQSRLPLTWHEQRRVLGFA
jgi:hypothetical protein